MSSSAQTGVTAGGEESQRSSVLRSGSLAGSDSRSVGIFDSGVGGLTVLRRIAERLPAERMVYLGDTARVPYGTKSPETVIRYARACSRILLERDIKLLVVACNTASAFALGALRSELAIPVLGVIEPGAACAVRVSKNGRIGIIGTTGTIRSEAYQRAVRALDPGVKMYAKACPLFVPLAEEGWTAGPIPRAVAGEYLAELLARNIDTLVLGCTHYPILKQVIREVTGDGVELVDSAEAVSAVVAETLDGMGAAASDGPHGGHTFLVSDAPSGFEEVGSRFLGQRIERVEWVDF